MALGRHGRAPRAVALGGVVGAHVGGPDEERPVAGRPALDQVDGLVAHHVGDVAVVGARAPVVVEARAVVAVGVGDRRAPVVPAAHPARARGVGVQRLADEPGAVAGVVQPGREVLLGVVAGEGLVAAVGPAVVAHAVVLGVLPGEDLRARRAAQRVRADRVGELRARLGEQAPRQRHVLQLGVGLVVGAEQDDVGAGAPGVGDVGDRGARGRVAVGALRGLTARHQPAHHEQPGERPGERADERLAAARGTGWCAHVGLRGRGRAGTGRGDRLAGK